MSYGRSISYKTEAIYGKYCDVIAELPPGKATTLHFHSVEETTKVRYHIYNWIKINHYSGAYTIEASADKKSLMITNNLSRANAIPTPDEIRSYLHNLPLETMFETTLAFIKHFQLLSEKELNNLIWTGTSPGVGVAGQADPSEAIKQHRQMWNWLAKNPEPTGEPEPAPEQPAFPGIWNWEETNEETDES